MRRSLFASASLGVLGSISFGSRPVAAQTEQVLAAARQAPRCQFRTGALPSQTLGADVLGVRNKKTGAWLKPWDPELPIKKIVIVMQENRSFDHYYGRLADFIRSSFPNHPVAKGTDTIAGAPVGSWNPVDIANPSGSRVAWRRATKMCHSDTNHEWWGVHFQWNGGKMNGFVQSNEGFFEAGMPKAPASELSGARAMDYYDHRDLPFYYRLAATFGLSDRYFSSLLGPTWPNRQFLYGATSRGLTYNVSVEGPSDLLTNFRSNPVIIFDQLTARGIPFKIYIDGEDTLSAMAPRVGAWTGKAALLRHIDLAHLKRFKEFLADAKNGNLPAVTFIDPDVREDVNSTDEHPPANVQLGQRFVWQIVQALMSNRAQWMQTALIVTYDEHGGFFDHFPPPAACPPDNHAPRYHDRVDAMMKGSFARYGVRVPLLVISPWAKKHYVSHVVHDHTSVLRFIQAIHNLPALTGRDANASALFDFFDFTSYDDPRRAPSADVQPSSFPEPPVDATKLAECRQLYPPCIRPDQYVLFNPSCALPTKVAKNPYPAASNHEGLVERVCGMLGAALCDPKARPGTAPTTPKALSGAVPTL
jgi:phospholipase C